jgi:hypothetical protein
MTRVNIKAIMADPHRRRRLLVGVIIATQAREGIETTQAQACQAYDKVLSNRKSTVIQASP